MNPLELWNSIADHWDQAVGEGSDFHKLLVFPAAESLLGPLAGRRVLDACCGNGAHARRMARAGASVFAFDGSARLIEHARRRTNPGDGDIAFHAADATDAQALGALLAGQGKFDAAVCNMAVMNLPALGPLLSALRDAVRPGSPIVISSAHPAFHSNEAEMTARQDHGQGSPRQEFGVEVRRYLTPWAHESRGLLDQPRSNWIFHRPLSGLVAEFAGAGLVIDGVLEPAFSADTRVRSPFSWSRRPEIPPVIVFRLRGGLSDGVR